MAISLKRAQELDISEFSSLPTLYPSENWVIAHAEANQLEKIEKQIGKDVPKIVRSLVVPYWLRIDSISEGDILIIEPLFPGYLFADIVSPAKNWCYLEDLEGIFRVLTNSSENGKEKSPYVLTPFEVTYIMDLTIASMRYTEPNTYGLEGHNVVVTEGLFKNFNGVVVEDGKEVKVDLETPAKTISIRIDRLKIARIL
jgi:transcription antitermination factor NusG